MVTEYIPSERFITMFRGEECDIEISILDVGPPPTLSVEFHSGNAEGCVPTLDEVNELVKLAFEKSKRRLQ